MTRCKLAVLLALAALPLQAKPRAPRPGAEELINKMLVGPATSYVAVERVQVFLPGKKPKALKVNITALPRGPIRRIFLPPNKKAAPLVQVRDREEAFHGNPRLLGNFDISVSTGGVVAKRKTWKLELRLKSGVLRRTLWVDRDSGLLMKRETYRDDGTLRRRERIVKLELPSAVDPALSKAARTPGPWMPDGFVFTGESGRRRHYSNGLESYVIDLNGAKPVLTGDIAEDDAWRALEEFSR